MAIPKLKTAAEFRSQKHRNIVYPSLTLVMNTFVLKYLLVCRQPPARVVYDTRGRYLEGEKEHRRKRHFNWAMQTTDFRDEDEGPPPFASLPSTGGGSTPPPPFTSMPPEVIIDSDSEISSPNLDDPIQSEYTSTSADTATSQPEETTRKKMIKGMIKWKRVLYTYMESMKSRIRSAKKRENV